VAIREIRGFDEAKVCVGEGADANTRGRVCSPELQTDAVFLIRVYAPVSDILTSTWNGHETIRSGEAVARCGRASVL